MVNLRFHIVSLVAVFLALALGITMGSAFIDRATVDTLKGRLDQLEGNYRERGAEIERLEAQLGADDETLDLLARPGSPLLAGRLDDRRVLMVIAHGIDEDSVRALEAAVEASGASPAGRVWLEPTLNGADRGALDRLRAALGDAAGGSTDDTRLRSTAVTEVARVIAEGADAGRMVDFRTALRPWLDADAVSLEEQEFDSGGGLLTVVVSGPEAEVDPAGVCVPLTDLIATRRERRTLAVEVGPARDAGTAPPPDPATTLPERGVFVGPIRDDRRLRDLVGTVDDGEQPTGRVSFGLGLDRLDDGEVVHLGHSDDADGPLPPTAS